MNNQWKQYIPSCIFGNILELYEFIIYGYFAFIIGSLFFPVQNKYTALVAAFGVFATGSIIRPFSSLFFGHIGDRLGRRFSLILSIGLMALSTLSIGLLPTYDQLGILSPILLILCRLGQGLSMTSEEIGAALFLMESAPNKEKGYAGSLVLGSVYLGLLTGSIITMLIFSFITGGALASWGWRIPFIGGGLFGLIILVLRINQPESYEFNIINKNQKLSSSPIIDLYVMHLLSVIRITFLFCLFAVSVYLFAVFIPNTVNMQILGITKQTIMLICSCVFINTFLVSLITGKLTDKIGSFIPLFISFIGFIIFSYPLFTLMMSNSFSLFFSGYFLFSILLGMTSGAIMLLAIKPFPAKVRFSGCCIAFNLSMSIFGSTTPLLALYLTKLTHSTISPAILLIIAGLISLFALLAENKIAINQEDKLCQVNLS